MCGTLLPFRGGFLLVTGVAMWAVRKGASTVGGRRVSDSIPTPLLLLPSSLASSATLFLQWKSPQRDEQEFKRVNGVPPAFPFERVC